MAGKRKEMSKIKQVLQLHRDGMSNRKIGATLGLYKGTVNSYVNAAKADNKTLDELLKMEEPALEHRLCGGNPAYSDPRFDQLRQKLEYIDRELGRKHMTMYLLWEEYRMEHPQGYGYTQFCYHVNQFRLARSTEVSFPFGNFREGGKEIYVDFAGDTMSYIDIDTGQQIPCQVFIACLPASDYGFAMAVPSQKVEDFLYAFSSCFRELGGVPCILVTDNLKASVIKADRYMPELNIIMEDFANHYGCVTIPTRAARPKDKSLVEDHVKLTYRRVYAPLRNETFFSLESLNLAIAAKMKLHNRKRMQRLSFTREERFLSIDKPNLKPLPPEDFEIKYRTELTVLTSSHVYLGRDKVYYSVPYLLIGVKVKVIYTRTMVYIYNPQGSRVATHLRIRKEGHYVTIVAHMPSYYNDYVNLSPDKYIERASRISPLFEAIVRGVFSRNPSAIPETFYKSCDGLFHLQKTTEPALFEQACRVALEFNRCQYSFIKNLIESKCAGIKSKEPTLFPQTHANIRGREYYE